MVSIRIKGTPASLGVVKGKVKILHNPREVGKVKKGDILVTEMTDPLYMAAIMKAAGIITNIGGQLSHAAIVARELKIPCIVNTGNATEILTDNLVITLDATKGEIYSE